MKLGKEILLGTLAGAALTGGVACGTSKTEISRQRTPHIDSTLQDPIPRTAEERSHYKARVIQTMLAEFNGEVYGRFTPVDVDGIINPAFPLMKQLDTAEPHMRDQLLERVFKDVPDKNGFEYKDRLRLDRSVAASILPQVLDSDSIRIEAQAVYSHGVEKYSFASRPEAVTINIFLDKTNLSAQQIQKTAEALLNIPSQQKWEAHPIVTIAPDGTKTAETGIGIVFKQTHPDNTISYLSIIGDNKNGLISFQRQFVIPDRQ